MFAEHLPRHPSCTCRVDCLTISFVLQKSLYWTPGKMPSPKVEYNLGDIILDMPKIYQTSKDEYLNIYSTLTVRYDRRFPRTGVGQ